MLNSTQDDKLTPDLIGPTSWMTTNDWPTRPETGKPWLNTGVFRSKSLIGWLQKGRLASQRRANGRYLSRATLERTKESSTESLAAK
ncbi:MAG: hypothetical protein EBT07_11835 [Actinobacteria bacterium]|nr:hypothetical protein [Actinomycetota bacterium]